MKKIIVLKGSPKTGKTTSLKKVHSILLSKEGCTQIIGAFQKLGNGDDILDVIQFREIRIGIITQGDYARGPESVKNLMKLMQPYKCNIIVCACTVGDHKDAIIGYLMTLNPIFVDAKKSINGGVECYEDYSEAIIEHIKEL